MRLKELWKRAVNGVVAAVRRATGKEEAEKPQKYFWEGWKLSPEAGASFAAAFAPRDPRRLTPSKMGTNGCAVARGVVMKNKETGLERVMPESGYVMDDKGTIRRSAVDTQRGWSMTRKMRKLRQDAAALALKAAPAAC